MRDFSRDLNSCFQKQNTKLDVGEFDEIPSNCVKVAGYMS